MTTIATHRFEYLSGKKLVKEEKIVQRYRFSPLKADANQMLTGTGYGTWGASNLQLTKLTTVQSPVQNFGKCRFCLPALRPSTGH
jgi:hypothetical protein